MNTISIKAFFDQNTFTVTYVVADNESGQCAVIDSVLDFDQASASTNTQSADQVVAYIRTQGFETRWILETHVHADHLSAAPYLKASLGGKIAVGQHITQIQQTFKNIFNESDSFATDGSQFDLLLSDGDTLLLGSNKIKILHTPGHTPACLTYAIADALFVGDTLFMPDFGTARTDFPGGDAKILFQSIKKILSFPDHYRVFTCHDYKAPNRDVYAWQSRVYDQKNHNVHVKESISEQQFIAYRTQRDSELSLPKLILPAVQINMRAGNMPAQENNGIAYLKLPINAF